MQQSLAIRRALGDRRGAAISLNNLGMLARDQEDLEAARGLHEESLAIARELGNRNGIARSLGNLGIVALDRLDLVSARSCSRSRSRCCARLDDQDGIAIGLHLLGDVARQTRDLESARACYAESLTILRRLGHRVRIVYSLDELAAVAGARGSPRAAARLWGAMERLREEMGSPAAPGERAQMPALPRRARCCRTTRPSTSPGARAGPGRSSRRSRSRWRRGRAELTGRRLPPARAAERAGAVRVRMTAGYSAPTAAIRGLSACAVSCLRSPSSSWSPPAPRSPPGRFDDLFGPADPHALRPAGRAAAPAQSYAQTIQPILDRAAWSATPATTRPAS